MPWRPLHALEQSVRPLALALLIAGASFAGLAATSGAPATGAVARTAATTPATHAAPAVRRPAAGHQKTAPHQATAHHRPAHQQHAFRSHRRVPHHPHRTGWVRPARGPVTSGYGPRWGSFHPGVDIGARYGSKVHAITGGRIVSAGWIPGYGKTVRVHADHKVFYYPHLSRIRVGHGRVDTGQVLGRVGSTGYSTGPHVHIEIRKHGRPVNPRHVLYRHGVRLG